jgi:hypothetical protein
MILPPETYPDGENENGNGDGNFHDSMPSLLKFLQHFLTEFSIGEFFGKGARLFFE